MKYTHAAYRNDRIERHRAFWQGRSCGRPLIHVTALQANFRSAGKEIALPSKQNDLDPQWHVDRFRSGLEAVAWLGDALPGASLMVGLDITHNSVLAGGDYDYSSNHEQIFWHPGQFRLDRPIPLFSEDHPLTRGLMNCYEAMAAEVGTSVYLNSPMTLDPLSSLYGLLGEAFLKAMVRSPELVRQRTEELTTCYLAFYDYFYRYLQGKGYGETGCWFNAYCEGRFEGVRCDFSVMLSEATLRTFMVPMLRRICTAMDRSLFNMSAVAHRRLIPMLAEVEALDGFFWNPEPFVSGVADHLDALRHMKAVKPCLEIVCYSVEDAVLATRALGPDGLYLMFPIPFNTVSEAEAAVAAIDAAAAAG